MTHEREAIGPDGGRRSPVHRSGVVPWRRPWERRVVVVDDDDGSIRLVTRSTGDLLGWSSADLRCAPYVEFLHPDDRELLANVVDVLRASVPSSAPLVPFTPLDVRVLARDRRYWWTRWQVSLTPGTSVGCATGVEYLAPDVAIGPPMGTWRWATGADTVSSSAELLDMFGFTFGPPASYDAFLAVVLEDDRDTVDRAVRRTATSGEPSVVDFRVPGRGGGERWFHATGRRVPSSAEMPAGMAGIVKHLNPRPPRRRGAVRPRGCG